MVIYITNKSGESTKIQNIRSLSVDGKISVLDNHVTGCLDTKTLSIRVLKPSCAKDIAFIVE